uniref:Putative AMP-dependent synthetase and ligase n=1 Tax=Magnetococcus massalia (strain MO-1) TaxID=451514 RepID=A0A1S7LE88_MAGMO|nr:putative AMP-dependent synthetase and ligase [Candidatus Magnetococcus massalia]
MTAMLQPLWDQLCRSGRLIDAPSGVEYRLPDALPRVVAGLVAAGVKPHDRVVVVSPILAEVGLVFLATLAIGAVVVPVEPAKAQAACDALQPALIWAPKAGALKKITTDCPKQHGLESLFKEARQPPYYPHTPKDLLALIATSGSTGEVKWVRINALNLMTNGGDIIITQSLAADDRAMLVLPLSYCYGISLFISHLLVGGDVVFDSRFMFADKVLTAIAEQGCTSFAGVPTHYRFLDQRSSLAEIAMPSLRRFLQAGGPLDAESIQSIRSKQPRADFYVMYGQTEATARLTTLNPCDLDRKLGSAGQPLPHVELKIDPMEGMEQGVGEVLARGDSITGGYWGLKEAAYLDEGWLRTGDIGLLDDEGFLWLRGRKAEFVKMGGYRVALGAVESWLAQQPGHRGAAAIGVPDPLADEALRIAMVPEGAQDRAAMEAQLRINMPNNWVLEKLLFVEQLPINERGKLMRGELRQMLLDTKHG